MSGYDNIDQEMFDGLASFDYILGDQADRCRSGSIGDINPQFHGLNPPPPLHIQQMAFQPMGQTKMPFFDSYGVPIAQLNIQQSKSSTHSKSSTFTVPKSRGSTFTPMTLPLPHPSPKKGPMSSSSSVMSHILNSARSEEGTNEYMDYAAELANDGYSRVSNSSEALALAKEKRRLVNYYHTHH